MRPSDRDKIVDTIDRVLDAIARETGKDRQWLSLEIEQTVTGAAFELFRRGEQAGRRPKTLPYVREVQKKDSRSE